jgi:acetyl-CoA acyltransferase
MEHSMKPVYIVEAKRSPLTKANKGALAKMRPDDILAQLLSKTVAHAKINPADIEDVVIGCAFPEGEQGLNVARIATLLAGLPDSVPAMTINRYCSSGLNAVAIIANRISAGEIEVGIAGGVESMSMIPMGGNKLSLSPDVFAKEANLAIAYGMGITAEEVARQWQVSREAQDQFALMSHHKAAAAQAAGYFNQEIMPLECVTTLPDQAGQKIVSQTQLISVDDGIRNDTSLEALAKLKPAFNTKGSVTPGNSSQMTDGAAVLILVSEEYLRKHNLTPLGRFHGFAVAGVPAQIMGIGPLKAIPKLLAKTGVSLNQIDWFELNEAFAAQSLAVINDLKLDPEKVNPYGGAIALGHPLGATGAVLSGKLLYGLRRSNKRYGIVTMCIGSGMGAAGLFEALS